jgi:ATP-dependent Clp protease ATP-binding subunit ClpB
VPFKLLSEPEIERIVDHMFNDLRARLADRSIAIEIAEETRRFIAWQGFDPVYGVRRLRRIIAREVEIRVGRTLLSGSCAAHAPLRGVPLN